jgi:hypothetical protein
LSKNRSQSGLVRLQPISCLIGPSCRRPRQAAPPRNSVAHDPKRTPHSQAPLRPGRNRGGSESRVGPPRLVTPAECLRRPSDDSTLPSVTSSYVKSVAGAFWKLEGGYWKTERLAGLATSAFIPTPPFPRFVSAQIKIARQGPLLMDRVLNTSSSLDLRGD